jgi:hypothetical protein
MSPYRGSKPDALPEAVVRYFKVDRHDLVYLKFILEAYEGMSTLSTVDQTGVIIRLSIPYGFADDVQSILDTVGADIPIIEVPFGAEDAVNA